MISSRNESPFLTHTIWSSQTSRTTMLHCWGRINHGTLIATQLNIYQPIGYRQYLVNSAKSRSVKLLFAWMCMKIWVSKPFVWMKQLFWPCASEVICNVHINNVRTIGHRSVTTANRWHHVAQRFTCENLSEATGLPRPDPNSFKASRTLASPTSSAFFQWWISLWAKITSAGQCFSPQQHS